MFKIKYFIVVLFLFLVLNPFHQNKAQSQWKYDVGLYGWFSGVDGNIGVANQDQQFQAEVSDLLKNLTFSAGGHFEARNPQLTLLLDIFYAGLSIDAPPVTIGDSTFTPNGSVDIDEWILEGTFGYRTIEHLEVMFALRYFILEQSILQNDNTLASGSASWPAFYLGLRYSGEFAEKWFGVIRGDAGYGGDGFAWFLNGSLGYRFSKLFSLALAYRMLNMDYAEGVGIDYKSIELTSYGLGLAFVFSF